MTGQKAERGICQVMPQQDLGHSSLPDPHHLNETISLTVCLRNAERRLHQSYEDRKTETTTDPYL
jgi:hypothetical protein